MLESIDGVNLSYEGLREASGKNVGQQGDDKGYDKKTSPFKKSPTSTQCVSINGNHNLCAPLAVSLIDVETGYCLSTNSDSTISMIPYHTTKSCKFLLKNVDSYQTCCKKCQVTPYTINSLRNGKYLTVKNGKFSFDRGREDHTSTGVFYFMQHADEVEVYQIITPFNNMPLTRSSSLSSGSKGKAAIKLALNDDDYKKNALKILIVPAGTAACVPQISKFSHGLSDYLYHPSSSYSSSSSPSASTSSSTVPPPPSSLSESSIVLDCISVLCGLQSTSIQLTVDGYLTPSRSMNPVFKSSVMRFNSLSKSLHDIRLYVDAHTKYPSGKVSHSISCYLKTTLSSFSQTLTTLHTDCKVSVKRSTLNSLWYALQPSIELLQTLSSILPSITNLKGGVCLNVLYAKVSEYSTTTKISNILTELMVSASRPMYEMIHDWISSGAITDNYNEFFIVSNPSITISSIGVDYNDSYWSEKYKIIQEHYPKWLGDGSHSNKVLMCGKYLNVLTECGYAGVNLLPAPDKISGLHFALTFTEYSNVLDRCYAQASKMVLDIIMDKKNLTQKLASVKRYFLLLKGDFFTMFMDLAESELCKETSMIDKSRLQTLLEMAAKDSVSTTASFDDVHHEFCKVDFVNYTLIDHLDAIQSWGGSSNADESTEAAAGYTPPPSKSAHDSATLSASTSNKFQDLYSSKTNLKGLESLILSYTPSWPSSLIISKKATTKYTLLFRHVFFAKYVQRNINNCWKDHMLLKEVSNNGLFKQTHCLRQRMLHFISNFVYYITLEVISPQWSQMSRSISEATTVDQVIQSHEDFLDTCLKECLLTNQVLLKSLTKLMNTCLLFSSEMQQFEKSLGISEAAEKNAVDERLKRLNLDPMKEGKEGEVRRMNSSENQARRFRQRKQRIADMTSKVNERLSDPSYKSAIDRFSQNLDNLLSVFMNKLLVDSQAQYHSHLSNLCMRLDYNGFWSGTTYTESTGHSNRRISF